MVSTDAAYGRCSTDEGTDAGIMKPRPSANIWNWPATYEIENRGFDRAGLVESAMGRIVSWAGRDVLDLGCGTGFHLPRWAETARSVIGVEPHPPLVALAERRTKRLANVTVLRGLAEAIPLSDASVDVMQARWAYFFGPGCAPGLRELDRVMRHGGTAFVIDNDPTTSTFGSWFRRGYPDVDPDAVEAFWSRQGWSRERVETSWRFDSRADFEAVVRIEFAPAVADRICATYDGTGVDYAVNLWWKAF